MSKLLRYFTPGQSVFITSVCADLLTEAFSRARRMSQFSMTAWVILPDHFHCLITSPDGNTPRIVQRIKLSFSKQLRFNTGQSGRIWQHQYWDHIIRSEDDMRNHIDYIHYNPVKHRLIDSPRLWPHSTFSAYLNSGYYESGWGDREMSWDENRFGE